jgi:hypothetical protein
MSTSKVILIGAISVVFGLYNLSLIKVNGSASRNAEIALYQAKAADNARSGVQRTLNFYALNGGVSSCAIASWLDPTGVEQGQFVTSASCALVGSTWQLTIVSHGYYRSPNEPAAFSPGHEVVRTAYAEFPNTNYGTWYPYTPYFDITLKAAHSVVNFSRERQLDSLQAGKSNLIGY